MLILKYYIAKNTNHHLSLYRTYMFFIDLSVAFHYNKYSCNSYIQ